MTKGPSNHRTAVLIPAAFIMLAASVSVVLAAEEAFLVKPRYYYNGAWHNTPVKSEVDLIKDYYWDNGRWIRFPKGHIHRPNNGYAFRNGRWQVDRNTMLGKQRPGNYYYNGEWHRRPRAYTGISSAYWLKGNFGNFVARRDYTCRTVEERVELKSRDAARLERLLDGGEVEKLLDIPREGENRPVLVYDRKLKRLTVEAKEDRLAELMTLVEFETSFKLYTATANKQFKCRAFSLIDPCYFCRRAGKSMLLFALNLEGVASLLDVESDTYRRSGAKLIVHGERLGTITVFDTEERLEKVEQYLSGMPYSPREGVKTLLRGR